MSCRQQPSTNSEIRLFLFIFYPDTKYRTMYNLWTPIFSVWTVMAVAVTGVISRHKSSRLTPAEVNVRGDPLFKETLLQITLLGAPHS